MTDTDADGRSLGEITERLLTALRERGGSDEHYADIRAALIGFARTLTFPVHAYAAVFVAAAGYVLPAIRFLLHPPPEDGEPARERLPDAVVTWVASGAGARWYRADDAAKTAQPDELDARAADQVVAALQRLAHGDESLTMQVPGELARLVGLQTRVDDTVRGIGVLAVLDLLATAQRRDLARARARDALYAVLRQLEG